MRVPLGTQCLGAHPWAGKTLLPLRLHRQRLHVRGRELARNECADHLKDKVERTRTSDIGLDPRFEYFRYSRSAKLENTSGADLVW